AAGMTSTIATSSRPASRCLSDVERIGAHMKTATRFTALVVLALTSGSALAAMTAEEAARLGAELTPMGAEKAGNADGTIPAWAGGIRNAAEAGFPNYKTGDHHPDPYANDKPLFTITADN